MDFVGLTLALLGPGLIALHWTRSTREEVTIGRSIPSLILFVLLVGGVAAIASVAQGLAWKDLGFGGMSWVSIPNAALLTLFFILVFAPIAHWTLLRTGLASFDAGKRSLTRLPPWYLCLTVIVVAAGEEWLYRGYAIERLEALADDAWLAGAISLLAFGLVHLPVWGVGVSLTTMVSGGILTAIYIWQRDISLLILAHVATDLYGIVISPNSRSAEQRKIT